MKEAAKELVRIAKSLFSDFGSDRSFKREMLIRWGMKELGKGRSLKEVQQDISRWMKKSVEEIKQMVSGKLAKSFLAVPDVNALNGVSNQIARKFVNEVLSRYSKGIFHDQSWEAVRRLWKALQDSGINYTIVDTEYQKDSPSGMPSRKQWKFEVSFTNDKGRLVVLYGVVIASGVGSVEDVLSKYDLVAYVS